MRLFKNITHDEYTKIDSSPVFNMMIDLGITKKDFPCMFLVNFDSADFLESWKFKGELKLERLTEFL